MNTYYLTQDSKGKWIIADAETDNRVTTNSIEVYLKFLNKKPKVKKETTEENEG